MKKVYTAESIREVYDYLLQEVDWMKKYKTSFENFINYIGRVQKSDTKDYIIDDMSARKRFVIRTNYKERELAQFVIYVQNTPEDYDYDLEFSKYI